MGSDPLIIYVQNSGAYTHNKATLRHRLWSASELDHAKFLGNGIHLQHTDLTGFSHVLASREGLYAIGLVGFIKISDGQFFGVTVRDNAIYCFEALGPIPSLWPHYGRIVRYDLFKKEIVSAAVVVKGLPNGCHQIDFIGGDLFICDTYNSRVLKCDTEFNTCTAYYPWGDIQFDDFAAGYPHMNSLVGYRGVIYLMLHNCTRRTGRNSQLVQWQPESGTLGNELTLAGAGCHNIVFLEDGELIVCDSDNGALTDGRRTIVQVGQMLTRGLSVDSDMIVVGSSLFSKRDARRTVAGEVCFLDRQYRELLRFSVPAAATDIRKIDGTDLSITNSGYRFRTELYGTQTSFPPSSAKMIDAQAEGRAMRKGNPRASLRPGGSDSYRFP
jgi:hypothetical protein